MCQSDWTVNVLAILLGNPAWLLESFMGQQSSRVKRKKVVDKRLPGLPSKSLRKFAWPQEWFATSKSRNQVYKMASKLGGLNPNLKDLACMVYAGALLAALQAHNFDAQSNLLSQRVMYLARRLVDKKITWHKSVSLLFHGSANFPSNLKGGNKYLRSLWATTLLYCGYKLSPLAESQSVVVGMVSIHPNGIAGEVLPHSKEDGHGSLDQEKAVQLALDLANKKNPTHDFRGQGVLVAVVDSGNRVDHPDLAEKVWCNPEEVPGDNIDNDRNGYVDDVVGWNFVGNTSVVHSLRHPSTDDDHGTHVAGTIVAHNPDKGVFGVAYDAKFMHLKVLYEPEVDPELPVVGPFERYALAIMYAVDKGAHIINLSWSGKFQPQLEQALEYAYKRNVVVIAAAGNSGMGSPKYPASSPYVVAVGNAVHKGGYLHESSNKAGNKVEYVSAPGTDILSTSGQSYEYKTGTSMATPYVSGVVARMLSANPDLSRSQVGRILASSSRMYNESLESCVIMLGLAGIATLCSIACTKTKGIKSGKYIGI